MADYGISLGDQQGPIGPGYSDTFARTLFMQLAAPLDPVHYYVKDFDNTRPFLMGYIFGGNGVFFSQYNSSYYNPTTKIYDAPPFTVGGAYNSLHFCIVY